MASETDPDVRFLLANERTVLAWLRTSLALQACGVGVIHFVPSFTFIDWIGVALILLGALAAAAGLIRYRAADAAIRQGRLPPHGLAAEGLMIAVTLIAVLLLGIALGHTLS